MIGSPARKLLHRGAARDGSVMAGLRRFWPIRSFLPSWLGFLCTDLPGILAQCSDVLSLPHDPHHTESGRRLDERIEGLSTDITRLVQLEPACARLKTLPGTRPITSRVMVAAIGTGDVFSKGRDFAAYVTGQGIACNASAGWIL
jgi:hypothetical protein